MKKRKPPSWDSRPGAAWRRAARNGLFHPLQASCRVERGTVLPLESGRDREFDSRVKFELVTKQGWKQWVGFNACYSQWPAALLNFIMDGPWEGADDIFIHFQFCRVFLREMRATYWTTGSEEMWNNYWYGFCQ